MTIIESYLDAVKLVLHRELESNLIAVWIGGSLELGGFSLEASDLDVMVVVSKPIDHGKKLSLGEKLAHNTFPCPALGLDLSVYLESEVRSRHIEIQYEMSFCTGREWEDLLEIGGDYPGAILDFEIFRQAGRSLFGPKPKELIFEVPREWLVEESIRTIDWHRRNLFDPFHDPTGANAVLNGCRVVGFMESGRMLSKCRAAANFVRLHGFENIVHQALLTKSQGRCGDLMSKSEVLEFLDSVEELARETEVK